VVLNTESQPEFLIELAQRCIERSLICVETSARESPLPGVTVHASCSTTQQKRCSTRDAAHSAIETGHISRDAAQRLISWLIWIVVIVRSGIDENDGDSCPAKIRVLELQS
jgi:hypothetical protein